MKKSKSSTERHKVTFGKRKGGKPRKHRGPKDSHKSKYRGQGR